MPLKLENTQFHIFLGKPKNGFTVSATYGEYTYECEFNNLGYSPGIDQAVKKITFNEMVRANEGP
jgi:hypothetical protein